MSDLGNRLLDIALLAQFGTIGIDCACVMLIGTPLMSRHAYWLVIAVLWSLFTVADLLLGDLILAGITTAFTGGAIYMAWRCDDDDDDWPGAKRVGRWIKGKFRPAPVPIPIRETP